MGSGYARLRPADGGHLADGGPGVLLFSTNYPAGVRDDLRSRLLAVHVTSPAHFRSVGFSPNASQDRVE